MHAEEGEEAGIWYEIVSMHMMNHGGRAFAYRNGVSRGKMYAGLIDKTRDFFYTEEKFIRFFQESSMSASLFTMSFAGQWWWRIFSSGRGCGLDA